MAARSAFVIDDSKSARFALRRYLENLHYVVETAESAETAFNYLKDHHPDVIFLDHVMPGVDGFDVLNSIKSDPRTIDIPVVICSSNEGEAFTQEARVKGAADVLSKPPSPQALARVLSSLERSGARPAAAGAPPAAPRPATPSAPAHAPPAAPAASAASAPAKPADPAAADRLAVLIGELRTELLSATADLSRQIAELKAQIAHLEHGDGTRRPFAKFRASVLRSKPRTPRAGTRRKLPRR